VGRKRAPGHVIAIALLGVIFCIAALVTIFQSEAAGWPLEYGAVLLVIGLILAVAGGGLAKKHVKSGGS